MKWQPIDTALKDESRILVYSKKDGVREATWSPTAEAFVDTYEEYITWDTPTHWMPLPDPPP